MAGESSKVNLNSLPKVASIITSIVNKEIDNLCFPGCLIMDIPCTTESQQIDKDGKLPDAQTFDEPQLEAITKKKLTGKNDTGGPEKYSDVRKY